MRSSELFNGRFNVGILNLVPRKSGHLVQNIQNLNADIHIILKICEGGLENSIAVEFHNTVADAIIFSALYASQKLDRDPFLLALHEGRHDFVDAIFIQTSRLDVVDILLVVFPSLFLPRALRHSSVPGFGILDAECFDDGIRKFCASLRLCLATDVARTIGFATVARLWISAVTIDVVIEHQLFSCLNPALGENTHP
jgi:hypothetical protein